MLGKSLLLHKKSLLIVILVVLSFSLVVGSVSAQDSPEDVAKALIDAENANDADTAAALFADDAVVTLPTGVHDTPEEIHGWQQEIADGHLRVEAVNMESDGNTVTWDGTVSYDPFRNLGIASIASHWDLTIKDGKIQSFDFAFTPEAFTELQAGATAAALIAAEAAHDVDGASALFADDAVVTLADGSMYDTPEGIRGWQQALADGNFRIEPEGLSVDGNTVNWMGEISLDAFRQMGLPVMGGIWKVTVEDGKVTSFDFAFTPAALEALQAASS